MLKNSNKSSKNEFGNYIRTQNHAAFSLGRKNIFIGKVIYFVGNLAAMIFASALFIIVLAVT